MTNKRNVRMLCLSAVFAALTVICTMINLPIGPVPINLAMLSVFLSGGVLGARFGTLSQLCYLLMGTAGLPVFSNFSGGPAKLAGPTGGYLFGYLLAAFLTGIIITRFGPRLRFMLPGMVFGLAGCYLLGTLWFLLSTKSALGTALMACVVPFLPGDALKIAVACLLIPTLRKAALKA